MVQLVVLAVNVYAIGLLVYIVLPMLNWPKGREFALKIGELYTPFLVPLRDLQRNSFLREVKVNLAPALLLAAVFILRKFLIWVLA